MKKELQMYIREYHRLIRDRISYGQAVELAAIFPWWLLSLHLDTSPLKRGYPWINLPAIKILKNILRPDARVFEYGSGGSTVFFAKRVMNVISVEHDLLWQRHVQDTVEKRGYGNAKIVHLPPTRDNSKETSDPSNPDAYLSRDKSVRGLSFKSYASFIDRYSDNYFDLIFIDGRARTSCVKHSTAKVKNAGCIVIDNTERDYYLDKAGHLLRGFQSLTVHGPVLGFKSYFCKTSFFFKPVKAAH
jgi:hypothetical protein